MLPKKMFFVKVNYEPHMVKIQWTILLCLCNWIFWQHLTLSFPLVWIAFFIWFQGYHIYLVFCIYHSYCFLVSSECFFPSSSLSNVWSILSPILLGGLIQSHVYKTIYKPMIPTLISLVPISLMSFRLIYPTSFPDSPLGCLMKMNMVKIKLLDSCLPEPYCSSSTFLHFHQPRT